MLLHSVGETITFFSAEKDLNPSAGCKNLSAHPEPIKKSRSSDEKCFLFRSQVPLCYKEREIT